MDSSLCQAPQARSALSADALPRCAPAAPTARKAVPRPPRPPCPPRPCLGRGRTTCKRRITPNALISVARGSAITLLRPTSARSAPCLPARRGTLPHPQALARGASPFIGRRCAVLTAIDVKRLNLEAGHPARTTHTVPKTGRASLLYQLQGFSGGRCDDSCGLHRSVRRGAAVGRVAFGAAAGALEGEGRELSPALEGQGVPRAERVVERRGVQHVLAPR
jgi:hypothetical protein